MKKINDSLISKKLYLNSFLKYLILNAMRHRETLSVSDVEKKISDEYNSDLREFPTSNTFYVVFYELVGLDLIQNTGKKDKENNDALFKISDKGFDLLQNQAILDLCASSFLGYQTYKLSKWTVIVSTIAMVLALVSILVTIYI